MFPELAACLLILEIATLASGAPVETSSVHSVNSVTETPDCNNDNSDVYDQRQNGTENYRIHVNGVVVLVAPPETILQASQLSNFQLPSETEASTITPPVVKPKPKPQTTVAEKVPAAETVQANTQTVHTTQNMHDRVHLKEKNNLRLFNLLHMFRNIKHETEGPVETFHH